MKVPRPLFHPGFVGPLAGLPTVHICNQSEFCLYDTLDRGGARSPSNVQIPTTTSSFHSVRTGHSDLKEFWRYVVLQVLFIGKSVSRL